MWLRILNFDFSAENVPHSVDLSKSIKLNQFHLVLTLVLPNEGLLTHKICEMNKTKQKIGALSCSRPRYKLYIFEFWIFRKYVYWNTFVMENKVWSWQDEMQNRNILLMIELIVEWY